MQSLTVVGAFSQGFLMYVDVRSRRDITIGGINIEGNAMPIRDGIT